MSRCCLLSHLLVISTVSVKEKVKVTSAFSLVAYISDWAGLFESWLSLTMD